MFAFLRGRLHFHPVLYFFCFLHNVPVVSIAAFIFLSTFHFTASPHCNHRSHVPGKSSFFLSFPLSFFLFLPSCLCMFCNHVISPFPALAAGKKDAALKKQQTRRRLVSKITVSKTGSREYAGCPAHSRDLFLSAFSSQQDVCAYSARMSSTQSLSWVNRATGRTCASVFPVSSAK